MSIDPTSPVAIDVLKERLESLRNNDELNVQKTFLDIVFQNQQKYDEFLEWAGERFQAGEIPDDPNEYVRFRRTPKAQVQVVEIRKNA